MMENLFSCVNKRAKGPRAGDQRFPTRSHIAEGFLHQHHLGIPTCMYMWS